MGVAWLILICYSILITGALIIVFCSVEKKDNPEKAFRCGCDRYDICADLGYEHCTVCRNNPCVAEKEHYFTAMKSK